MRRRTVLAAAISLGATAGCAQTLQQERPTMTTSALPLRQHTIAPIGAAAAIGDIPLLTQALNDGLDAGLSISDAREILVQLYAYAGFPRSLNALGELMKTLDDRKKRGIQDVEGRAPSRAAPKGDALMAAGTANQTKLSGAPVTGALFDFAPAINDYLRAHLFGDIFERDNLDWQSRELATVSMLSTLQGVDSQLQAHVRISMNTGLTEGQLRQLIDMLADRVAAEPAQRAREALARHLATTGPR
jgi:alkylhydroperoxidase/carboxymuconolactone decarboxylase family protein YurZ